MSTRRASWLAWSLAAAGLAMLAAGGARSEEHTSELQSQFHLVCRLLLEKKKKRSELAGSGSGRLRSVTVADSRLVLPVRTQCRTWQPHRARVHRLSPRRHIRCTRAWWGR